MLLTALLLDLAFHFDRRRQRHSHRWRSSSRRRRLRLRLACFKRHIRGPGGPAAHVGQFESTEQQQKHDDDTDNDQDGHQGQEPGMIAVHWLHWRL